MRINKFGIKMSIKKLLIVAFLSVLIGFIGSQRQAYSQQPYSSGEYGSCKYSEGCEVDAPPSTVITVPPSTTNPQQGRVFAVNITNEQTFNGTHYVVLITPNFPSEQISSVQLFVNGTVVGSSTTPDGESYRIDWTLPQEGRYELRVVMQLADGETITQDFVVFIKNEVAPVDTNNSGTVDAEDSSDGKTGLVASIKSLVDSISRAIEKMIQLTPVNVAYSMPYGFLALLVLIALLLVMQTRNQLKHIRILLALLDRDKAIADEKSTFIMLVSHYLRTPLTILQSSFELLQSEGKTSVSITLAQTSVAKMHEKSEEILRDVQSSRYLKHIVKPDLATTKIRLYRSWKIILPAVLSIAVLIMLNLAFIAADKTELSIPNIVVQVVLLLVIGVGLLNILQTRRNHQQEIEHVDKQNTYQEALDRARNKFITRVAGEITPLLNQVKASAETAVAEADRANIDEALSRLEIMIGRFILAAELEKGKIAASLSSFELNQTIEGILKSHNSQILLKKLQTTHSSESVKITQSDLLVHYVINALIDNAIRYSKDGGQLMSVIKDVNKNEVRVMIRNQGEGIPSEKIASLFKPFSRSEGVETFNEQGIGLNLYLSRLITRYLGGDIELQSRLGKDVSAVVTLPRKGAME